MKNTPIRQSFFFALVPVILCAETHIQGIIDKDTRWTTEESPYILTGDIYIPAHIRLRISPGVRILAGKPFTKQPDIPQQDHLDSVMTAIRVRGVLSCIGRTDNRIVFTSLFADTMRSSWYGIILDSVDGAVTELAYTTISKAVCGISVTGSNPLIRNGILEFNTIGIDCSQGGNARVYNSVIARNFVCGIRIREANPLILNTVIALNHNNGIWCDGKSSMTFHFNCLWGNRDGDMSNCNPECGILTKTNHNKDSTDKAGNLFTNPIFAGSPADSAARYADIENAQDTTAASGESDESFHQTPWRYRLSDYSPCVDAGSPAKRFRDDNETRNDIGVFGGPEFFREE